MIEFGIAGLERVDLPAAIFPQIRCNMERSLKNAEGGAPNRKAASQAASTMEVKPPQE
ncbi:hypothetical protein GTP44_03140 [Duganella sp. FT50W]|uniref:Uncharacterized protein n=1 Tax=Duganella lactea TaxID=2692173 RepID=A0A6L8MDJ8_9BURK|nr:hypothetical protein [Duganella lactea]MYM80957.1 hypothetical protein [Duganella lactea]